MASLLGRRQPMTAEEASSGVASDPSQTNRQLSATACKPIPRWAEELRAEHNAMKEGLKEYMAGFWDQAVLKSKEELREEMTQDAVFWQGGIMQELGKTSRASSMASQELARLRIDIQKFTQAVECQQALLEAKTALQVTPQRVLVPAGKEIAEQQRLFEPVPQPSLAEAVNRGIETPITDSEWRMSDRLDEMQRLHLNRFDAIQDDSRLDTVLKRLQSVEEFLAGQAALQSPISVSEQNGNTGDPLIELGKCPSLKSHSLINLPTEEPLAHAPQTTPSKPVVVQGRKSVKTSMMQIERLASSRENDIDGDPDVDNKLGDLFDDGPPELPVEKCLRYLNYISLLLVVLNTIYMGVRVDITMTAVQQNKEAPHVLQVMEHLFTASFVIELCMRLALEKLKFFNGMNAGWNLFDTFIVAFQLLEALQIHDLRNTTFVRIISVARIVKTARALRTLKNMRILRLIMAPEVWQPLIWGVAMLLAILYLFAVFITTVVMDHTEAGNYLPDRCLELYGSVYRTQYTPFKAFSGGEAWGELLKPLEVISVWNQGLFLLFMVIMLFGVINTISAVYVDALLHFSTLDRDIVMTERNAKEKGHLRELRTMFLSQPLNEQGLIEQQDLLKVLEREGASLLKSLGLQLAVAKALFRLLDVEDSRAVEVDENIYGLLHLKGNAATIHMATLMYQSKRMLIKIQRVSALVEDRVMPILLGTDHNPLWAAVN